MLKSFISSKMPWLLAIPVFILKHFLVPVMDNRMLAPRKMIGIFGPFRFHPRFLFRDYRGWGSDHNCGFVSYVNACKEKKCVIDIGGHIGLTVMPVAKMLAPEGRLYVFEPADANRAYLLRNIELNSMSNTEVLSMFVGAECRDDIEFFESDNDSGLNSMVVRKNKNDFHKALKKQVSMDNFCAEKRLSPEVIKIDVEGAEFDVLAGAAGIMMRSRPVIYLSLHPSHLEMIGRKPEEIHGILERVGYGISNIDGTKVEKFSLNEYILAPL